MDYGSALPNQNKGYAKQEKTNLLNDDPIAKDASGGRPMILKHMSGSMGSSPAKMHHEGSPAKMHDGKKFEDEGFMDSHYKTGSPRK
jgi:hypothetical protein